MGLFGGGPYSTGEIDEMRRAIKESEAKEAYRNFIKNKKSKKSIYKC